MKFKDSNGIAKEHTPLKDRLLLLGFDEHMLIKDGFLIQYCLNPKVGLFGSLKNIWNRLEFLNESGYAHFSKKHRRINPVFVKTSDIISPGDWIAFTPSVLVEKETSLYGKMSVIVWSARILTKLVRVFTRKEDLPQFLSLILSNNREKFNTSQSYFYEGTRYLKELNDDALVLTTSEGEPLSDKEIFILSPSALGKTDCVYVISLSP